jgi:hypothetical protein
MQKESLSMAAKYSYVSKKDTIATRICEGKFEDVVYQVGRVQFGEVDENGNRSMRFKYEVLDNPHDVEIYKDEFMPVVGSILVEQIEEKLKEQEIVYANGKD